MSEAPKPEEKVKFYADCPDGTKNKLFTYSTYDFSHSYDILNRAVNRGFKIRAAFHTFKSGMNMKLDLGLVDGDLTTTYAGNKELNDKADKWQSNLRTTI